MPDDTSARPYSPRPGSKAEAAVVALERNGWMRSTDLAAEVGCSPQDIFNILQAAVRENWLRRVVRDGINGYELGPAAESYVSQGSAAAPAAAAARRQAPRRQAKARSSAPAARQHAPRAAPPPARPAPSRATVAVMEDGRVALVVGDRVQIALDVEQVNRIVELVVRLRAARPAP